MNRQVSYRKKRKRIEKKERKREEKRTAAQCAHTSTSSRISTNDHVKSFSNPDAEENSGLYSVGRDDNDVIEGDDGEVDDDLDDEEEEQGGVDDGTQCTRIGEGESGAMGVGVSDSVSSSPSSLFLTRITGLTDDTFGV